MTRYDRYNNPLITADALGNETQYFYGSNEAPCGEGSNNYAGFIFQTPLMSSKITCIENALGHQT